MLAKHVEKNVPLLNTMKKQFFLRVGSVGPAGKADLEAEV
jgi:hypothetical protein